MMRLATFNDAFFRLNAPKIRPLKQAGRGIAGGTGGPRNGQDAGHEARRDQQITIPAPKTLLTS